MTTFKLTQDQIDMLEEVCEELGVSLRTEYSGRFMYGKTCVGVVGNVNAAKQVISALFDTAESDDFDAAVQDDAEYLAEVLDKTGMNQDSMGLEVISYWPSITA